MLTLIVGDVFLCAAHLSFHPTTHMESIDSSLYTSLRWPQGVTCEPVIADSTEPAATRAPIAEFYFTIASSVAPAACSSDPRFVRLVNPACSMSAMAWPERLPERQ